MTRPFLVEPSITWATEHATHKPDVNRFRTALALDCISGGGAPSRCPTPTHTRSLSHPLFQAIGATREALFAAHSARRPFFLFAHPRLCTKKFRARIA